MLSSSRLQLTQTQVGGEYPMTSTTALEAESGSGSVTTRGASQTDDKLHRGRNVVLAFLMQGESYRLGGRDG
jgi:hypothetical protein